MAKFIFTLFYSHIFQKFTPLAIKDGVEAFRAQIAQFVDIPDILGRPEQVGQENMEDLSVEVCGKNGAYYKVSRTKLMANPDYAYILIEKLFHRVMWGIFTRIKSLSLFNTSTYAWVFGGRAGFFIVFIVYLYTVIAYKSISYCFQTDWITTGGFLMKKFVYLQLQTKDVIYMWTTK